ncbi:hypothetical protein IU450_13345 [Nocardia abscessus]|uniref:hypothetical protein n=1 Tax=Nocardia abscessus TaxID=120957 RepID=UPI0018940232|nr:hypothetical protein [Nocardia abscessus]MBF6336866.1 hypothetical protein [Nocardia abscessus]
MRTGSAPGDQPGRPGHMVYVASIDGTVRAFNTRVCNPAVPVWETGVGYLPGTSPLDDPARGGGLHVRAECARDAPP